MSDNEYPLFPGWKGGGGTSRQAADVIAPKAKTLRERVLAALERGDCTPEEVVAQTGVDIYSIRPRFSELKNMGIIRDSGKRRTSRGGLRSIVWTVRAEEPAP